MSLSITGVAELDKALSELGKASANRVMRSATSKALRVFVKATKGKVPAKYKELKKAIGYSAPKAKNKMVSKFGVGVGMTKKRKAKFKRKNRGNRPGLGIQPENAHWFVLGTADRTSKKTGKSTGKMAPLMPNVVKEGFQAGEPIASQVIIQAVTEGLAKEAKRLAKK